MVYAIIGVLLVLLIIVFLKWRQAAHNVFFTPAQERRFLSLVMEFFTTRHLQAELHQGVVLVPGKEGNPFQFGLGNIAQLCRMSPEADWPELIDRHFTTMVATMEESQAEEERLKDFQVASELLMVRLMDESTLEDFSPVTSRKDIPGLISYLALDMPTTVRSVVDAQVEAWGRPVEDLFALALDNVLTKAPVEVERPETGDVELVLLHGENFFVASHALLLHTHPECVGPYGALVSIPTRHTLLCCPIRDSRVVQAVNLHIIATHGMAADGPGTISNNMYWYRNGTFTHLPYHFDGKKINFMPPQSFIDLLGTLTAAEQTA